MRYDSARLAGSSPASVKPGRRGFDGSFFLLVMILLAMGVLLVLSASFPRAYYDPGHVTGGNAVYYFVRQLLYAVLGVGVLLLASRLPMEFYRRWAFPFLGLTILLLALVPLVGVKANGSRRWLGLGGLTLQPSELAKLAVILSFSVLICRFGERMKRFRWGILPFLGILGVLVGLLILEPHFSASVILGSPFLTILTVRFVPSRSRRIKISSSSIRFKSTPCAIPSSARAPDIGTSKEYL